MAGQPLSRCTSTSSSKCATSQCCGGAEEATGGRYSRQCAAAGSASRCALWCAIFRMLLADRLRPRHPNRTTGERLNRRCRSAANGRAASERDYKHSWHVHAVCTCIGVRLRGSVETSVPLATCSSVVGISLFALLAHLRVLLALCLAAAVALHFDTNSLSTSTSI